MSNDKKRINPAKYAALVGIMAATIECAKLALATIPNIEVVTFLIALFSYTFGFSGVIAAFVFVAIEPLIWGFGTWLISYFIYWPLVALVFVFLGRARIKNRWILTATALVLTLFFGVLTSLVDVGLFSGYFDNFLYRFAVYYSRGIVFYLLQLGCNAVLFLFLFGFASDKLSLIKSRFLQT